MTREDHFAWAIVGATVGMILGFVVVAMVVIFFLGAGGLMPDDPIPKVGAIYIGVPFGGYLGWRLGPEIAPGLVKLLQLRAEPKEEDDTTIR